MVFNSGFGSNAKVVKYRLRPEEGEAQLYSLTPRMVKALLSNTDYLSWMNRHTDMPSDVDTLDALEAWVSKLNLALMTPVLIDCEFLKDCLIDLLENDPDVLQTLIDLLGNSDEFKDKLRTGTGVPSPTNPSVTTENLDALFGAVTFIVDTMNDINIDLFQIWEQGAGERERFVDVYGAMPLLNLLPFGEVVDFIDQMFEDVVQEYESEYTTTPNTGKRDIYRCGLFCAAVANGHTLDFDVILNYFSGLVGFTQNPLSYALSFINFFTDAEWSGVNVPDVSFLNLAIFLKAGSSVAGVTLPSIQTMLNLGSNNLDPDWTLLDACNECGEEEDDEECFNFIGSTAGWQPWQNSVPLDAATHTPEGWDTGYNAGFSAIIYPSNDRTVIGAVIKLAEATPTTTNVLVQILNTAFTVGYNNTTQGLIEYTFAAISITGGIYVNVQTDAAWTSTQKIEEICLIYEPL